MISCQILGCSYTFKILLFFSVRVTKIPISISLAANHQENSITPKEMIIYLTVQNNTQGNGYVPWRLRITLKEIVVSLPVQNYTQGKISIAVLRNPKETPIFLGGLLQPSRNIYFLGGGCPQPRKLYFLWRFDFGTQGNPWPSRYFQILVVRASKVAWTRYTKYSLAPATTM